MCAAGLGHRVPQRAVAPGSTQPLTDPADDRVPLRQTFLFILPPFRSIDILYVPGSRYFQYCHTMQHPLHRAVPYEGDLSSFTSEERWLLGEPRSPGSWVYGSPEDKVRMDRFRRQDPEADYYQRMLRHKQGEGERARLRERSGMQPL